MKKYDSKHDSFIVHLFYQYNQRYYICITKINIREFMNNFHCHRLIIIKKNELCDKRKYEYSIRCFDTEKKSLSEKPYRFSEIFFSRKHLKMFRIGLIVTRYYVETTFKLSH